MLAHDTTGLTEGLHALLDGSPSAGLVTGQATDRRLALVFSGQGGQRTGMGRVLRERSEVFARAWHEVATELDPLLDRPLDELVKGDLGRTGDVQPALFALQVAQFRLLESWGVRPDVLVGIRWGRLRLRMWLGFFRLRTRVCWWVRGLG